MKFLVFFHQSCAEVKEFILNLNADVFNFLLYSQYFQDLAAYSVVNEFSYVNNHQ